MSLKGWSMRVPLEEVQVSRILREAEEAGSEFILLRYASGYAAKYARVTLATAAGADSDFEGPVSSYSDNWVFLWPEGVNKVEAYLRKKYKPKPKHPRTTVELRDKVIEHEMRRK